MQNILRIVQISTKSTSHTKSLHSAGFCMTINMNSLSGKNKYKELLVQTKDHGWNSV